MFKSLKDRFSSASKGVQNVRKALSKQDKGDEYKYILRVFFSSDEAREYDRHLCEVIATSLEQCMEGPSEISEYRYEVLFQDEENEIEYLSFLVVKYNEPVDLKSGPLSKLVELLRPIGVTHFGLIRLSSVR